MDTFGPNLVTVELVRGGEVLERHVGTNLITTLGIDLIASAIGGGTAVQGSPATATTSTTFAGTGGSAIWTADALIGKTVVFGGTAVTVVPVHGHITDNAGGTATVDGWWSPTHATATTPAGTAAFVILEGACPAKYIALTNDSTTPSVADTTLASEITTNGLGRALATYAHTASTNSFTLSYTWTATGAQSARKAGLFTGLSAGILVAELAFTPLSMVLDDSLTVTWTWNLPAAG